MLALEPSRRQHASAFPFGTETAFDDPYLSHSMNAYGSFDSTPSFESMPFPFYDSNTVSSGAAPDTMNLSFFAAHPARPFNQSFSRSELPPPALSNASAASIPSNTSSRVGSPYSSHAQPVSGPEPWSAGNHGFGIGPTIINNEGYDQSFGGVDLGSEMTFSIHGKVAEDFVGECTNVSPSRNQLPKSAFSKHPQFSQPSQRPINGGPCMAVDSLEHANIAIESSFSPSLRTRSSSVVPSSTSEDNLRASSRQAPPIHHPLSRPTAFFSRGPNPSLSFSSGTSALGDAGHSSSSLISLSVSGTTAATSTPTCGPQFQSPFFCRSSRNFVPPIGFFCSFFSLLLLFHHSQCRSCKTCSLFSRLSSLYRVVLLANFSSKHRSLIDSTYKLHVPRCSYGVSRSPGVPRPTCLGAQLHSSIAGSFAFGSNLAKLCRRPSQSGNVRSPVL